MRNLLKTTALLLLVAISFSCSSDDDDKSLSKAEIATNETKWISSTPNGQFASFEFNKSGNYIIVENVRLKSTEDQNVLFGTYEIIDNSTIKLSDIGTITVISVTDTNIQMDIITENSSSSVAFNALKAENLEETTKTNLLCQTWEMKKYNGVSVVGTEDEGAIVLFSKAGTYFLVYPNDVDAGGLALWKWKPESNESQFLYSWSNSFEGEYDGSFVTVNELTADYLKITEIGIDDPNDISVWEWEPVSNKK